MSHLLERGHPSYKWIHPLSLGLKKMRLHKRSNGDNAVLGRMRRSRLKKNRPKKQKTALPQKSAKHALFGNLPPLRVDDMGGRQKRANKPCFEARFFWQKRKIFNFSKTRREQGRNTRPISNSPNGILARQAKRLYRRATPRKCATPARRSTASPPRASARLRDASRRRGQNRNLREF